LLILKNAFILEQNMRAPLYPVFYGTPIQLRTGLGWISGHGITRNQREATWFAFVNTSGTIPWGNDQAPRLVSYGDAVNLLVLPKGDAVGLSPTPSGVGFKPQSAVMALPFSVQPAAGQPTGQPITALNQHDSTATGPEVNGIYLQNPTWGTLFVTEDLLLQLSLVRATEFQVVAPSAQRPSVVSLPLPLPIANSFPVIPTEVDEWYEPFVPLMKVPSIIPMNPISLQISSTAQPDVVCIFKNSFCLPRWLAVTVLVFTFVTLLTILASKLVK
jgi:hypothetical protein